MTTVVELTGHTNAALAPPNPNICRQHIGSRRFVRILAQPGFTSRKSDVTMAQETAQRVPQWTSADTSPVTRCPEIDAFQPSREIRWVIATPAPAASFPVTRLRFPCSMVTNSLFRSQGNFVFWQLKTAEICG